jgi:hypothetical protein
MKFQRMPSIFPGQSMWGCREGSFTFIITDDGPAGFSASAKIVGTASSSALGSSRHDLGGFGAHKSLASAEKACRDFYRNRDA